MWNFSQNKISTPCFFGTLSLLFFLLLSCSGTGEGEQLPGSEENAPSSEASEERSRSSTILRFDDAQLYKHQNNVLRVAITESVDRIDPHSTQNQEFFQLLHALFAGLVTLDPITHAPRPSLARNWQAKMLEKGYTYRFTLRGVYWTDDTPITATQVAESLLRAIRPPRRTLFSTLLGHSILGGEALLFLPAQASAEELRAAAEQVAIYVLDEQSLTITARSIEVPLLRLLAHPQAAVLPIDDFRDTEHDFSLSPERWKGAGPFVPLSMEESMLELGRRRAFWSRPWIKKLQLHMGMGEEEQLRLYQQRKLDLITYYPALISRTEQLNPLPEEGKKAGTVMDRLSALVLLDVAPRSWLHAPFYRDARAAAQGAGVQGTQGTPRSPIPQDALQGGAGEDEESSRFRLLAEIQNLLYQEFPQTQTQRRSSSFYFPRYLRLPSTRQPGHASYLREERRPEPSAPAAAEAAEEEGAEKAERTAETDTASLPLSRRSVRLLSQYLKKQDEERGQISLKIGYDADMLLEPARAIANFFAQEGVRTELLRIAALGQNPSGEMERAAEQEGGAATPANAAPPASEAAESYDIALRLYVPALDVHYALLLSLWHAWQEQTRQQDEALPQEEGRGESQFDISGLSKEFLNLLPSAERSELFMYLERWDYALQHGRRAIPLWHVSGRTEIDSTRFKWWTTQEQSWHPLYP